jgi:hypothetical protein
LQEEEFMLKKIILIGVLLVAIVILIFITSPESISMVGTLIFLVSLLAYVVASLFLPVKKAILAPLFLGVFLTLNLIIGFDLLNTILLLCFIIGLSLL